jgi:catechol 2,3-dioxygenase-like lactoylglutathione lyase family enzyme
MPVSGFQHVNTRSADVERTKEFYVHVLGFRAGDRPPFASRGYWLYLGEHPVLHLVQRPPEETHHDGGGNVDHIAFHAVDLEDTRAALRAAGLAFREAVVPRDNTIQIFVRDPDGITVELNFARDEAAAVR